MYLTPNLFLPPSPKNLLKLGNGQVNRPFFELLLYLWRNVVWCSAEGGGGHVVLDAFFAHSKIGNLAVPISIQ